MRRGLPEGRGISLRLTAYAAWLAANTIAGIAYAPLASTLFAFDSRIILDGLYAGLVYGTAQWLALRPFFPRVWWWLPATVIASPVSWQFGVLLGIVSFSVLGWLGSIVSGAAQFAVLSWLFRRDRTRYRLSFLWLPASVLGGAVFYFALLVALSRAGHPPALLLIVAGSLGYAAITGLVVAALVGPKRDSISPPAI